MPLTPVLKKEMTERPHIWKSGPDRIAHDQYHAWLVHRAQASFRGEAHELSFEDYKHFWDQDDNWFHRGRSIDCIIMSRRDPEKAWSRDNIRMMDRRTHLEEQAFAARGKPKARGAARKNHRG